MISHQISGKSNKTSQIITFYSFKGGVGRTMALANIAILLRQWGYKVLILDWDLEAPGLDMYFDDYIDSEMRNSSLGIIDILSSQIDDVQNLIEWKDCLIQINIPELNINLDLITSGKRDGDYYKRVKLFDIENFYTNFDGSVKIEGLRAEWLLEYDFILVDSRAGVTDIGRICTVQLPDVIIPLFTANYQSFFEVINVCLDVQEIRKMVDIDRTTLRFLPIPSRFDNSTEFKLSQFWIENFKTGLRPFFESWFPLNKKKSESESEEEFDIRTKSFIEKTKIPYMPYFSFGEKLPVIEQGTEDPGGIGYAFESVAAIIANNLNDINLFLNDRDTFIAQGRNVSTQITKERYYQINERVKPPELPSEFFDKSEQ